MSQIAPSTIAMTIYNYLQLCGQPMTAAQMVAVDGVQAQHPVDEATAESALDALVELKRLSVTVTLGGFDGDRTVYESLDPRRRLVTKRDRSDGEVNDDGTVTGGWGGWEVQNGAMRMPIEEAIR